MSPSERTSGENSETDKPSLEPDWLRVITAEEFATIGQSMRTACLQALRFEDIADNQQTLAALLDAVSHLSVISPILAALGEYLRRNGRSEEAVDALRAAMLLGHSSPESCVQLGRLLREANRVAEAETVLRQAAQHFDDPSLWWEVSQIMADTNRPEQELAALQRVVALQPNWPEPYARLGLRLLQLGWLSLSEPHLRRAAELNCEDIAVRVALVEVLIRTERLVEARNEASATLALEPLFVRPSDYKELAQHLSTLGQHADAILALRLALDNDPDDADAWMRMSHTATVLGDTNNAVRWRLNADRRPAGAG